MKVLLIGGAGYVGSVLTEELLERGYSVKIFDRFYYGDKGIEKFRDRVEIIAGDMREMKPEILEEVGAVVNIGGLSNDPTAEYNPKANYEMNTLATKLSAELCKKAGVKRYVFASSCSIYDVGVKDEEKDIIFDETAKVSPKAAYSSSKYEAEKILLSMKDKDFSPVILRKGTIYGFSYRMRYDLVVNTFVKDALTKGYITPFYGGEMWRPLVDIRDVAKAYILCIEAEDEKVSGEIFNLVYRNFRISELALRVRSALKSIGIDIDIRPDYRYRGVRSYRVSGEKIKNRLGFIPAISVEESVIDMVEKIKKYNCMNFEDPVYYNIRWMRTLEKADQIIKITGKIF
ncbi:SDR family oxidoreductase [Candidatus Aminicenantes bacterium AC-335-A11]|jgi:nucleoside-diphosphate-sugar epimerase|nr:SDR family oxidoreductase [SCandidatus Aminicenantes bacterium Aminicenantia_JdfR_composite]MCP2597238.1 SDR family oxidoreductase [Candidatus Aminicenantes bacterium AC-335-G13]MCP2605959.1 SDR family oxidoreductase [Candidatus Aminicenantes bacterium AC-708-I09]MCP2618298.1 SDR family oxidoreductase [Candidatus Aminicenantes bacterium AC-335-A11]MCP2620403.1 SDR family oxidoreductase [Candidatus Aminicenantes bacterium AC-334-E05]